MSARVQRHRRYGPDCPTTSAGCSLWDYDEDFLSYYSKPLCPVLDTRASGAKPRRWTTRRSDTDPAGNVLSLVDIAQ
jgi:hypothetical protein